MFRFNTTREGFSRGRFKLLFFQILKATGMGKKDSDAVIGMIMDVSGARDTVEDALGMLNNLNFFG